MGALSIAKKVAAYRAANSLTIQQMARQTGLSTAIISQLERNLANPCLSVLETLANTLGLTLPELLEDDVDDNALVLRAEQREKIYTPSDEYMFYNLLTPPLMGSSIQMHLVHLEPKSQTYGEAYHCHKDEEVIFVLSGQVTVLYELSELALKAGDTMRIPGGKKHRYRNEWNQMAELLTIKTNRNF